MKTILTPVLLFMIFVVSFAQGNVLDKSIDSILKINEETAATYIDNRIRNSIPLPQTESTKAEAIALRLSIEATIKNINEETREKFKDELQNVSNLQVVKDFIEYRYKIDIGGLSEEFYKKVAVQLEKL
ncbi:MAG: hypothetical protein ACKVOQ_02590 [Cyclobacteriaceae bacterium]